MQHKWPSMHGSMTNKIDGEWDSTPKIMMQEFAIRGHSVFECSFPLSRGVLKCKRGKEETLHYNAETNSAAMLMKNIAVLIWYFEKRSEGENISPNTDLTISQDLVTRVTRHETSEVYCLASSNRPRSEHRSTSVAFKSRGQVSLKVSQNM